MGNVLVAFEYSGTVGDAFVEAGHHVVTCDLLPTESKRVHKHIEGGIESYLMWTVADEAFDLIIAHPPCTYMAVSGNRWYAGTPVRRQAVAWTKRMWNLLCAKGKRVAMENPVGVLSQWRKPEQYIQPWQFGNPETKKTGLWLHNLPLLVPTHKRPKVIESRVWRMPPGPNRGKERSRFFPGVAAAMADQWGSLL